MKRRHKTLTLILCMALVAVVGVAAFRYGPMVSNANKGHDDVHLFIRQGDTRADVERHLSRVLYGDVAIFEQLCQWHGFTPHAGRYVITPGTTWLRVYQKLATGSQDPVVVAVRSDRRFDRFVEQTTASLALSHDSLYRLLQDTAYTARLGFTPQTVWAMFIPGDYEMLWDTPLDAFIQRMRAAYDDFWTTERRRAAEAVGLTPIEVSTLASIVCQESHYEPELPALAGVYINRLRQHMRLQACPTAIFAAQAWGVNRVSEAMTRTRSPYNTYLHEGLPPGPICIPTLPALDAVLHYKKSDYLYFAAAPELNGRHVFAATYEEHEENGRRYVEAFERWQQKKHKQ